MERARVVLTGLNPAADGRADAGTLPAVAETPVGIGDLAVAAAPAVLVAIGLGSCVGVMLHDARAQVGALAHIFLPEAPELLRRPDDRSGARGDAPAKFADVAIPAMVRRLVASGAARYRLRAKLAGGARVLAPLAATGGGQDVGSRNVQTAHRLLEEMRIPIAAEAVGGEAGRTVRFDVGSGVVEIRSLGRRVGEI